ncbi:MAG: filamentous hemagglutinin N-terminal domain-containing protein [Parachlamydiales bacterium]|nr:filamentous hemagglutinin N-terminal domain-containing protein [Parachlamydiales bacterium]
MSCCLCYTASLFALPKGEKIVSGDAQFSFSTPQQLHVSATDKTIIDYKTFSIGAGEKITFTLPDDKSCILNRVIGKNISEIQGHMESNGRLFLVNPQGIYFGKNAQVNAGSFIASTLNIKNEDFLEGRFHFFLEKGKENGSIVNEGSLLSNDGCLALLSPHIKNTGSLFTKAEKIILASAEKVSIDFLGNGLMKFTTEGELEQSLIENFGMIEAAGGAVCISVPAAKAAVKMVVNTDGMPPANALEEKDGVFYLVHKGTIQGKEIAIEAPSMQSSGQIQADDTLTIQAKKTLFLESSSLSSGKELFLSSQEKIKVRDSKETSSRIWTKGNCTIQSPCIDILTLSHPNSGFFSGGNMTFISENPISADAHFYSGGDFTLLKPDGKLGDFISFFDPIISSNRGCQFGSYNGVSLKVEAQRTIITTGTINITGPDISATGDSDSAILTTSAALILRANLPSLEHFSNVPIFTSGTYFSRIYTSAQSISLGGNITTAGGPVMLYPNTAGTGDIVLNNNITIATSGGDITVSGTINNARTLTLNAGAGDISVSGAIGNTTALTSLTVSSVQNASFNNITAGTISQLAGTGTSSFGALSTSTVGGISLTGNAFTFNNTVTTAAAGSLTLANTGTATFISGTNVSLVGGGVFNQSTSGAVSLAANITTQNANISFNGPVTIAGTSSVSTGSGGGNIDFYNTLDGTQNLSLTAGTGSITFHNPIGSISSLGALSIASANNVTATTINASSFSQTAGTGTTLFNNTVVTTGSNGISFTGNAITMNNTVTTTNNGPVTITNSGLFTQALAAEIVSSGAFIQNGSGQNSLAADITGNSDEISFSSPITLTNDITMELTSGIGDITLSNSIDGTFNYIANGNGASVTLSGPIGASTPLASLTISGSDISVGDIGAASAGVTGTTTLNASNEMFFTGTTYHANTQSYAAATNFNMDAGALTTFTSSNDPMDFTTGTIQLGAGSDLTITSSGGTITLGDTLALSNPANDYRILRINADTGTVHVGSIGTVLPDEFSLVEIIGGDLYLMGNIDTHAISLVPGLTSTIYLGGGISTVNNPISFTRPVIRNNVDSITLSSSGGDITFDDTLDSDVAYARSITLAANTGSISFLAAVGAITPLNHMTINSALNWTVANALTIASLTQSTGTGTSLFQGPLLTSGIDGISLTGTNFTFQDTVTTTNNGNFEISNSGVLTLPPAAICSISGYFHQLGIGAVSLGTQINANHIGFNGPVTLTDNVALDTSSYNAPIDFYNSIDGNYDLTLTLGLGSGSFQAIGTTTRLGDLEIISTDNLIFNDTITAASFSQLAGNGQTIFYETIDINGSNGITFVGNDCYRYADVLVTGGGSIHVTHSGTMAGLGGTTVDVDQSYLQDGTGSNNLFFNIIARNGSITFTSPCVLVGNSSFDTSGGNQDIRFLSTLDGGYTFTCTAGTGNLLLQGAVGHDTPLGNMIVNSAQNVTVQSTLSSLSFQQLAGTGTTLLQGTVATIGSNGISIQSNNITRSAAITTTGSGGMTITNSGTFDSSAAGNISVSGAFVQNGTGSVLLANNITTTNQPISFTSPITLTGNVILNTGLTGANITLNEATNGAFTLELDATAGNITVGDIGAITPLSKFYINKTLNASVQKVYASSIQQIGGTGTTTFHDSLTTTGALGINLQGTNFTFEQPITTTTGPLTVTHTGTAEFQATATASIDGIITINGNGTCTLSSSLTASDEILFLNPIIISGTPSLSTAAANKPITFFSTIDGPGDLTLDLGTSSNGNLSFEGNIGSTTPLGALIITNAYNVTTEAISAASLTQTTGANTSDFRGSITTSAIGGITLTGVNITFEDDITTASSGPCSLQNSGILTFTPDKTVSIDGAFTQTNSGGTGTIVLAGTIQTNNTPLSFVDDSPITLAAAAILNSGEGDLTISGTVNGTNIGQEHLTLAASATSDITCSSNLGSSIRLGNVTISTVKDFDSKSITALSISQLAGTGTTSFIGNVNTSGVDGISITGEHLYHNGNTTTTGGGSVVYALNESILGSVGNIMNISGELRQIGTDVIIYHYGSGSTIIGDITSQGHNIVLTDTAAFTTQGNLTVYGDINSESGVPHNCLFSVGGNISFIGNIGQTSPLNIITVSDAINFTANKISAASLQIGTTTPISSITTFNDIVTTSDASGILIKSHDVNLNADITTSGGGSLTITNSNILTIDATAILSLDGPFVQNGGGENRLGSSITTNNQSISFASPLVLTAEPARLDTGTGSGDITINTLSGAYALNLRAGTGDIYFLDHVGLTNPLTGITIESTHNLTASSSIDIDGPLTLQNSTGTASFQNTLSTTTAGGISLTGIAITFADDVTTTGGGPIALSHSGLLTCASGISISSDSTFIETNLGATGTMTLGGSISTNNANLSISSPVILSNSATLSSGTGSGDILLSASIDATVAGTQRLTLASGLGNILATEPIGTTTRLGKLEISNAYNVTLQDITLASLSQLAGTGTSLFEGTIHTNTSQGIVLTGTNFTFSDYITTTNSGSMTVTNSGLLTRSGTFSTSIAGSFLQNGTGSITLGDTISAQTGISFTGPINLGQNSILQTTSGNITVNNTIDEAFSLTTTATSGTINFLNAIGGTSPLASFTTSASQITHQASLTTTGAIQHTGSVILGGDVSTTNSNVTVTGNVSISASDVEINTGTGVGNIAISGFLQGTVAGNCCTINAGTGNVSIGGTTGASIPLNDFSVTGHYISLNNVGSVSQGITGNITLSATDSIDFNGDVYNTTGTQNYTANNFFYFNKGALTTLRSNNTDITFTTGGIHLSANNHFTLQSNGGLITLTTLTVADDKVVNLIADASVGTISYVQIGTATNFLDNVLLKGATITPPEPPAPPPYTIIYANNWSYVSPSTIILTTDVHYDGTLTYDDPVILGATDLAFIWDGPTSGDLTFNNLLNSADGYVTNTTFSPGAGNNLVINSPIGAIDPLGSVTINDVTDVTINNDMQMGSFSQINGSGTTTINGDLTTTAVGGISIQTADIDLFGDLLTENSGPIVIDNSGLLQTPSCVTINSSGAFQQIGSGTVEICGTIITHDAEISFNSPVKLLNQLTLTSKDTSGGNISFSSTIKGSTDVTENLILTAGSGDITFLDTIGESLVPLYLGYLNIASAHDVSVEEIYTARFLQTSGTGTTSFNQAASFKGTSQGLSFTGNALTIDNTLTTTNEGPLLITNSGLLTLTSSADCTINGNFTQNGTGASSLAGAIAADGSISFATAATLTDAFALDTSSYDQTITFSQTLDGTVAGSENLTIDTGNGDLFLLGAVGQSTRLGILTITQASNVTASTMYAASIIQTNGSGTTTLSGSLNTLAGGISLNGTKLSLSGNMITTGSVSLTHTGDLIITGGGSTSIDGTFTESGGGTVRLGGSITTTNTNLTFNDPIVLTGTSYLSTGTGIGDISLATTLNGGYNLTLTAGTGDILFGGTIGNTVSLGALTIASVQDISYPIVKASSITQSLSSGTTIIGGTMTSSGLAGIALTGNIITQNASLITQNEGPITITNSGLLTIATNINSSGPFSQNGTGTVDLSSSLIAANDSISFDSPVTLTATSSVYTGSLGANILFDDTIDGTVGTENLTLTATSGSITCNGNIGATIPIGDFLISSAYNATFHDITASSLTQSINTGTTIFNGAVSSTNTVSLTGTNFTINNDFTVTSGDLNVSTSGIFSLTSAANLLISGNLEHTGTGSSSLNGIVVTGGYIDFNIPNTIISAGTANCSTAAANQPITFYGTVEGPGNLTLASGSANISFADTIGASTRLGTLTITNTGSLVSKNITAEAIVQSAGNAIFNGALNTNGVGGIDLNGTGFTFAGNVTTTGSGPCTITNAGTCSFAIGKNLSLSGAFTQDGTGPLSLGSNITTDNADIHIVQPTTLTALVSLSTGTGSGNVQFDSTINGNYNFSITAGTGNITATSPIGNITRLRDITVYSVTDLTIDAVSANSISQLQGSGISLINGNINTNGSNGIYIVGNNFIRSGDITTTNGGSITITNSGLITGTGLNTTSIDGYYIQNGTGPLDFGGTITAKLGISLLGPMTLLADGVLDTSTGNGNIVLNNTIDGAKNFTINAGTGNVSCLEIIGGSSALTSLTIDGRDISLNNIGDGGVGITGTTDITSTGQIHFSGTSYKAHTQNYSTSVQFAFDAGALTTVSSSGNPILFTGGGSINLSTNTDLTINSDGGSLTLENIYAETNDVRTLIIDAGSADLQVQQIGMSGDAEFSHTTLIGNNLYLSEDIYSNMLTLTPSVKIYAAGNISTNHTDLIFSKPVELTSSKTFSTGSTAGGNIVFSDLLDSDSDYTHSLTLTAGTGNILFNALVGSVHPLYQLTITNAQDVSAQTITAGGLTQSAGSGTTSFNGDLDITKFLGINLTGTNFTITNNVTTAENGSIVLSASGLANVSGTIVSSGAFTQSGNISFSGSLTTGQNVRFQGPVTLSGSPFIDTSATEKSIAFNSTVNGSGNLTLQAGGGNITFASSVGTTERIGDLIINNVHTMNTQAINASSIYVASSTEQIIWNDTWNTNAAGNAIHLIGKIFVYDGALETSNGGNVLLTNSGHLLCNNDSVSSISGSFIQNGTAEAYLRGSIQTGEDISFDSSLILVEDLTLQADQNITLNDTVDGNYQLTLQTGGDITLNETIGSTEELKKFLINSASNVETESITAEAVIQAAGTNTSIFHGSLKATGTDGIQLTGNIITQENLWTISQGPLIVTNAGTWTANGNKILLVNGAFTQNGTGNVSFEGNLNTNNQPISFYGPITLTNNSGFITGAVGADMTFYNTIDGAYQLSLISKAGDITFGSALGSLSPLNSLSIQNAYNVTTDAIYANIFNILAQKNVYLNTIAGNAGNMELLQVDAENIFFGGTIAADTVEFTATQEILNSGSPVAITTVEDAEFNALGGDVGSYDSPILIYAANRIFVGSTNLADFSGTDLDDTVHYLASNIPMLIIWNGRIIFDRRPTPSQETKTYAMPGLDSSSFSLANDFFFKTLFYMPDQTEIRKNYLFVYRKQKKDTDKL